MNVSTIMMRPANGNPATVIDIRLDSREAQMVLMAIKKGSLGWPTEMCAILEQIANEIEEALRP